MFLFLQNPSWLEIIGSKKVISLIFGSDVNFNELWSVDFLAAVCNRDSREMAERQIQGVVDTIRGVDRVMCLGNTSVPFLHFGCPLESYSKENRVVWSQEVKVGFIKINDTNWNKCISVCIDFIREQKLINEGAMESYTGG